jgi:hypothetical protein
MRAPAAFPALKVSTNHEGAPVAATVKLTGPASTP